MDDMALLREYARTGAEAPFAALVQRHIGLVYSAANRQLRDAQLAEDVTQAVFIALARKAGQVARRPGLSGWLLQAARYAASTHIRTAVRRTHREQEAVMQSHLNESSPAAWAQLEPHLDEAMASLGETDRAVLALRYFENLTAAEIGRTLNVNEETAQRRATRALDKLRKFFAQRGIVMSAGAIAAAVSTHAVQAVPAALAGAVTAAALSGTAATTATIMAATKTLAMTTLQKITVTAALAVTISAGAYEAAQNAAARAGAQALREKQASLAGQVQTLETEQSNSAGMIAALQAERDDNETKNQQNNLELLQLRSQVGLLRGQLRALQRSTGTTVVAADDADLSPDTVLGRINLLKDELKKHPEWSIPEIQYLRDADWMQIARGRLSWVSLDDETGIRQALADVRQTAKTKFGQRLNGALSQYVKDHGGDLPDSPAQLKFDLDAQTQPPDFNAFNAFTPGRGPSLAPRPSGPYPPVDDSVFPRYQMIQSGNLNRLATNQYIIAEKAPVDDEYDTLVQVGLRNVFVTGIGSNASVIGWSGTPDLAAMTPDQKQRYDQIVLKANQPRPPALSAIERINNDFQDKMAALEDEHQKAIQDLFKAQSRQ